MNSQEDNILQKVKELINIDITKMKYHEIPHILVLATKIVYEDETLHPSLQKDLMIKVIQLLIDKTKELVPHMVNKYIEIDNGTSKIKIRTYGKMGNMWIKIRTFLDRKILG
jgi:hypothetical protein